MTTEFLEEWMKLLADGNVGELVDLFADDAEVVRFPGVASGKGEIKAYLIGFLAAHGKYELVSIDQIQEGTNSVIWEATVTTKAGPLQTYGVFVFTKDGKIKKHFPGIQGYWGAAETRRMNLGVGLIGSGYMGKVHASALRAVGSVFDPVLDPRLELLADVDAATAASAAEDLGFARSTGDWRELIADPDVDLVDITAPNLLHEEMALAAIEAGKDVYCEKPLAPEAPAAKRMVDAAEAAGIRTMTGFNYLKNPITALAKEIIAGGEIGEVFSFRGWHLEDYMLDPDTLVNAWRFDPRSGDGVTADLGSHIISMARYLVGPIVEVSATRDTLFPEREIDGSTHKIEVADQFRALTTFANGSGGTIEASWVATGRKMAIGCEVRGTKGAIYFDFERLNELQLYTTDQPRGREGFKLILAGPAHKDFAAFTPAPGHQLSFNDLKIIEVRDLLDGLAKNNPSPWPDFREAWEVQRVVDAISESDRIRGRVPISPAPA